jgi:hypothetical protein
MLFFFNLVDKTQISTPLEHTMHQDSRQLLILLSLRAIYFSTFQYETPCNKFIRIWKKHQRPFWLLRVVNQMWYVKTGDLKSTQNLIQFFIIKSSEIAYIFLPAFYLIIWLLTTPKNFWKIAILKIWLLVFCWGVKTTFGKK